MEFYKAKESIPMMMNYAYIHRTLLQKAMEPVMKEFDLKASEFGLLLLIHLNPALNTASAIANYGEMKSGNISVLVENLSKRGFIEQQAFENDRRMKKLVLTESTNVMMEECDKVMQKLMAKTFEGISIKDLELCEKVFNKMYENIKDADFLEDK